MEDSSTDTDNLVCALIKDDVQEVKKLMENGVNPDTIALDGINCLMVAAECGQTEIMKVLINNGASVDMVCGTTRNTALICAVASNNRLAAQVLLEAGANINITNCKGNTALMEAIESFEISIDFRTEMISMLLQTGRCSFSIENRLGWTALHLASRESLTGILEMLIYAGADPNLKNSRGQSPLMLASEKETAELLISKGSDPNMNDTNGRPCLDYSITRQVPEVAKVLIKSGADVNAKYQPGLTPLFSALLSWVPCVVEDLVESGCSVTYVNEMNRGAMYFAASIPDTYVCQYLMTKGARLDSLATDKTTPIYIAVSRHNTHVAKFLLKHNVDISRVYPHDGAYMTLLDISLQEGLEDLIEILHDMGCMTLMPMPQYNRMTEKVRCLIQVIERENPRTLVNITRNKIRNFLGLRLFEALPKLQIPKPIKDYVSMNYAFES